MVHWIYDVLYELNLECDIIFSQADDWSKYDLLIFPQLYVIHESLVSQIREFVNEGGTVLATFRSFMADENVKIFADRQPHGLTDCFGMTYNQYTRPVNVMVDGAEAQYWMELLKPTTAEVKVSYQHKYWGKYAALTRNEFGSGHAWYLGTMLPKEKFKEYLLEVTEDAGIQKPKECWPLGVRSGIGAKGQKIHFLFNYSSDEKAILSQWKGKDLLDEKEYEIGQEILLKDWGVCILEENL